MNTFEVVVNGVEFDVTIVGTHDGDREIIGIYLDGNEVGDMLAERFRLEAETKAFEQLAELPHKQEVNEHELRADALRDRAAYGD